MGLFSISNRAESISGWSSVRENISICLQSPIWWFSIFSPLKSANIGNLGKIGRFVQKTKNRSKHRVFENFWLKFWFFFSLVYLQSVTTYEKFIAPKTKNLGRFSRKNDPPPGENALITGISAILTKMTILKIVFSDK